MKNHIHIKQVIFNTEVTSTPTRPVDNVAITTKGLQDRNKYTRWDDGGK